MIPQLHPLVTMTMKIILKITDPDEAICALVALSHCHHRAEVTWLQQQCAGKQQLWYFQFSFFTVSTVEIICLINHCLLKLKGKNHQRNYTGLGTATARPLHFVNSQLGCGLLFCSSLTPMFAMQAIPQIRT